MSVLSPLQQQAISKLDGPVLVISAAGTGKTKVLTHRIAKLISDGVSPESILAVTFTNKAAKEMRERLDNLTGKQGSKVWIGTFHSICLRILRKNCALLGFKSNFTIFDDHDKLQMIKRAISNLGYSNDVKTKGYETILSEISKLKIKLITTSDAFTMAKNNHDRTIASIYMEYQSELMNNNAMDFDDIIGHTIRLLQNFSKVRKVYQNQFKYVLVDEYQDVNNAQYVLTRLLSEPDNNLFVVGDDAQAIYGFRLADMTNILNFENDFPNATVIRLEQNYRSTANIIKAANSVINHNVNQLHKKLWTDKEDGEPIILYRAGNDIDEATFVASTIYQLSSAGMSYDDFAVLYRTSFQSRVLEDIFMRQRIPYVIVNGLSFYERKEIKDILAYLKVIANSNDSLSLSRIINVPKRGIGSTTIDKLLDIASKKRISLYESLSYIDELERVTNTCKDGVTSFKNLIEKYQKINPASLKEFVYDLIQESGYLDMLKNELAEASIQEKELVNDRIDNIYELVSIIADYEAETPRITLVDFLQEMSLISDTDRENSNKGPHVRMLTVHAAKGLEFKNVFLVGMEERLFPHQLSIEDNNIEEERRLCYVAITRAIDRLFISHSKTRNIYGRNEQRVPSRFLDEIPVDVLQNEGGDYRWL